MKAKVKCGILACAICVVLGAALCLVTISRLGDKRTARKEGPGQAVESTKARLTREKLRQAVRNAKGGDRNELDASIESVARGRYVEVTEELLPDFVSFLQDEDPQVQLLGAQSLYALKSPESTETLSTYLRGKDFAKLKEMADTGGLDARHAARWEGQASVIAILALGEIGDKSAIPLLESLKEVKELHDGAPVERALAKLGAIESLSNVPPGADNKRIWRACDAISEIKDPQKVLELMATVYNKNCALPIRDTALPAL